MLIGVTGTIGSGKTSVARMLGELLGAPVLSADSLCRSLMQPDREGYRQFVAAVGNSFLNEKGSIDRDRLRKALFENRDLKETLETILHPLVRRRVLGAKADCRHGSAVVAEVPLLFESGWESDFDLIITVHAPIDQTVLRVVERDGGDREDVMAIVDAQMAQEAKCQKADFVIDNSRSWEETEKQIYQLSTTVKQKILENHIKI